jgi:hypothetical protein
MKTQEINEAEIEISIKLYKELETLAKAKGLTIDQFINKLLELALKKPGNKERQYSHVCRSCGQKIEGKPAETIRGAEGKLLHSCEKCAAKPILVYQPTYRKSLHEPHPLATGKRKVEAISFFFCF